MNERFHIDTENVMHETIDGEVVIVNLETGTYYAFDGTGEFIWNRLCDGGASLAELVGVTRASYAGADGDIEEGVTRFFNALQKEKLLVAGQDGATAAETAVQVQGIVEFTRPQLNIYTDMEALLLADPIHEVEPDGWPNVR